MIKITFPDGSVKPFVEGVTAYQIAESISPRLAAEVLAASVNGTIIDLDRPINEDSEVRLVLGVDLVGHRRKFVGSADEIVG